MESSKLFLKQNQDHSQFEVLDTNGKAISEGSYEITEAIKNARKVSDAPIDFGNSFAGFERLCVPEKPLWAIEDTEMFIAALAEIGGMKVKKLFNDDMNFIGFTMELIE